MICKAKKNKKFLGELISIEHEKSARRNTIKEKIQEMNDEFHFNDNANQVSKKIKEDLSIEVKDREVIQVMK